MSIYAYVGLIEVLFKLVLVTMLLYAGFSDNLIAYASICACWSIGLQVFYRWYCVKHFDEAHLHIEKDKTIYKNMLSYSVWDLIGQFCATGNTQGTNILLNMFFGVTLNAASSVASSVLNAITVLNNNFTTSVQPQIVKSYAISDHKRFFELIYSTGKFSFFLIYILALPVALEAPYILSLWLKEVPQYTTLFLWVTIVYSLLRAFANPIVRGVHATGNIKFLNFSSGIFSVSVTLPVLYFWVMFIITIIRCIGCNIFEVVSLHRNIHFSYWNYFKKVYLRSFMVALVSAILPVILVLMLPSNFGRLALVTVVSLTTTMTAVYYLGLDKATQVKIVSFVKRKISRNKN
jgi:O-antigen/teichoic acid export membrane protein